MSSNQMSQAYGGYAASDEVSGILFPKKKLAFGPNGIATDVSSSNPLPTAAPGLNRSDSFTGVASGSTLAATSAPVKSFSIAVKGTGTSATTWNIVLEGSLDGVNFTSILTHTNTTGDGVTLSSGTAKSPCLYFRSRVTALSLGSATNVVVTILGVP